MPICSYSVHSGSHDGPLLSFANVGETVNFIQINKINKSRSSTFGSVRGNNRQGLGHSFNSFVYFQMMGMLVKKCFVTDGDGDEHSVIDEYG